MRRKRTITVLHEGMKLVVGTLPECELKDVFVNSRELVEWKYLPVLVSYCCNIPESMDMPVMRHSVAVK